MKKTLFLVTLLILSFALISCLPKTADFTLKEIPEQTVFVGDTFSLDLSKFVEKDQNAIVEYAKKTGLGTINGSVFSFKFTEEKSYEIVIEVKATGLFGDSKDLTLKVKAVNPNSSVYIRALEYRSGTFNPDISFDVTKTDGSKVIFKQSVVTKNGLDYYHLNLYIAEEEYINILAKKTEYGLSLLRGLKAKKYSENSQNEVYEEIVVMKSSLYSSPDNTSLFGLDVKVLDASGNETLNISNQANVRVKYTASNNLKQYIIYSPMLDKVPGAGGIVSDRSSTYSDDATFVVNSSAYVDGDHVLYTVAYDQNNNRIEDIKYVNVTNNKEALTEQYIYKPINITALNDPSDQRQMYDVYSYTRRVGLEFYSEPGDFETASEMDEKMKGTNLYNVLYWFDYDSLKTMYANKILSSDPASGVQRPLGYNVYRSFDGTNFEKIGYVSSDFTKDLAFQYFRYRGMLQLNFAKYYYKPMFIDASSELQPGKTAYYAVSSVYNAVEVYESQLTYLGSVTPLEQFNVELKTPADGSVDVSQNPTFTWDTTNKLTSPDGTVTYIYNMFIYDKTQASNGLITPLTSPTSDDLNYGFDLYDVPNVNGLASIQFTGNVANNGVKWYSLDEYAVNTPTDYAYDKLESNKTYGWGVNEAYAQVEKVEQSGQQTVALSITNDYRLRDTGWYVDPFQSSEPDLHADFTTGMAN